MSCVSPVCVSVGAKAAETQTTQMRRRSLLSSSGGGAAVALPLLLLLVVVPTGDAFVVVGGTVARPPHSASLLAVQTRPTFAATAAVAAARAGASSVMAASRPALPAADATRCPPPRLLFGRSAETPVQKLQAALYTIGWVSWWSQVILSTVSGALLLFANSVTASITTFALVGRTLAIGGLGCAVASTLWALGYARLARKIGRDNLSAGKASERTLGRVRLGLALNVAGIALCLLGAEAIVGTLAAKAFTQNSGLIVGGVGASCPIQALDVLIVQANTNTLASNFISLLCGMRLRGAAEQCAAAEA